jgi:hypothetical protein
VLRASRLLPYEMLPLIPQTARRNAAASSTSAWEASVTSARLDASISRLNESVGALDLTLTARGATGEAGAAKHSQAAMLRGKERYALKSRGGPPVDCPLCKRTREDLHVSVAVQVTPSGAKKSTQTGDDATAAAVRQQVSGHSVALANDATPLRGVGLVTTNVSEFSSDHVLHNATEIRTADVPSRNVSHVVPTVTSSERQRTLSSQQQYTREAPRFHEPHNVASTDSNEATVKLLQLIAECSGSGSDSVKLDAKRVVDLRRSINQLVESCAAQERALRESVVQYTTDWHDFMSEELLAQRDQFSAHYGALLDERNALTSQRARLGGLLAASSVASPDQTRMIVDEAFAVREQLRKERTRDAITQAPVVPELAWAGSRANGDDGGAAHPRHDYARLESTGDEGGHSEGITLKAAAVDASALRTTNGTIFRLGAGIVRDPGLPTDVFRDPRGPGKFGAELPASDDELRSALLSVLADGEEVTRLLRATTNKLASPSRLARVVETHTGLVTGAVESTTTFSHAAVMRALATAQPHTKIVDPRDRGKIVHAGKPPEPPKLVRVEASVLTRKRFYAGSYPESPRFSEQQLHAMGTMRQGGTVGAVSSHAVGQTSRLSRRM